jgi:hypothetical protein
MTPSTYADFLRRTGHTVIQTGTTFWFDVSRRRIWQAFPYHRPAEVTNAEVRELLVRYRFVAARFPTTLTNPGLDSYRHVCDTKPHGLNLLSKKSRNQTRRGLETLEVRQVSFSELAESGIEAQLSTLSRQQRTTPNLLMEQWKLFCREAAQTPGFLAWGAYHKERLGGYLISFQIEDCANISILRSCSDELSVHPNNCLVFVATQSLLTREDVREVSFGWESLRGDLGGLAHFKEGMGFRRQSMRQQVILHPWLQPFLKCGLADLAATLSRPFTDKETYFKLRGFCRAAHLSC